MVYSKGKIYKAVKKGKDLKNYIQDLLIKVGDNEMIELAKTLVFEYFTYLGGKYEGLNPITYRDTKMFLDAKKHADIVCEYMN